MKLNFRQAIDSDLPNLVNLLAKDKLGALREDISTPLNSKYIAAFQSIKEDKNNELVVAEVDEQLVGMLQVTFIPYLTHTGSRRCLIEGVRITETFRGRGMGAKLIQWAIDRAKETDCSIVQLTSNKERPDAIRFYESLGFTASHEGFKMDLTSGI